MDFMTAIQAGFRNYVNFSGRASRSEYWWWVLFVVIVGIVASFIDISIVGNAQFGPVGGLTSLALLLPNIGISVRRLHDRDKSGWFILIGLIPLVGAIILLVWFVQRGTVGGNQYGPDPLGGA